MRKTNKKPRISEASFSPHEHLACEKEIRRRAYEIWEGSGGSQGTEQNAERKGC